jgi:hypothetical protein
MAYNAMKWADAKEARLAEVAFVPTDVDPSLPAVQPAGAGGRDEVTVQREALKVVESHLHIHTYTHTHISA